MPPHTTHTPPPPHTRREEKRKEVERGRIPHAVDRTQTHVPICAPGSFSPIYIKSLTRTTHPKRGGIPLKTVVMIRKHTPKRGFLYYVNIEFARVTEDKA